MSVEVLEISSRTVGGVQDVGEKALVIRWNVRRGVHVLDSVHIEGNEPV